MFSLLIGPFNAVFDISIEAHNACNVNKFLVQLNQLSIKA